MKVNGALGSWTYLSRYSRHDLGCFTYVQSFRRLLNLLGAGQDNQIYKKLGLDKRIISDLASNFCIFPSMRGIQFLDGFLNRNERLYNCAGIVIDKWDSIYKCFYLLLCGSGVGFNVSKKHVSKLRKPVRPDVNKRVVHVVEDSIRGWALSVKNLIDSYLDQDIGYVDFDYSNITPKGVILKSCGRPAPGAKPLERIHDNLRKIMDHMSDNGVRPIHIYDLVCTMSSGVEAGGVRRSALICLFSYDDEDMLNAKVGDWWKNYPHRALSNNSFIITPDIWKSLSDHPKLYKDMLYRCLEYGEPGVVHLPSEDHVVNPCCEIVFYPWIDGESSYQMCNLTEVSATNCKSEDYLEKSIILASVVGTFQACFTYEFLCPVAKAITERDRLLGVSITGLYDYVNKYDWSKYANIVGDVNSIVANYLGIDEAARLTCIKPSGTVSCLAGHSSGIHPYFDNGIRNIIMSDRDTAFHLYDRFFGQLYRKHHSVSDAYICPFPYTALGTRWSEVSPIDLLKRVKLMTDNWIRPGYRSNKSSFHNSVSCTVMFTENDIDNISNYICEQNKCNIDNYGLFPFVGISFLAFDNKYQSITSPFCSSSYSDDVMSLYMKLLEIESFLPDDAIAKFFERSGGSTEHYSEFGCDGDYCLVKQYP